MKNTYVPKNFVWRKDQETEKHIDEWLFIKFAFEKMVIFLNRTIEIDTHTHTQTSVFSIKKNNKQVK